MLRIEDGQAQVRYLVVRRSRGRATPCAVHTMHKETRSACFLVQPQNQGRRVSQFGPQNLSYLVFMPKPCTHRMHDPGSIVPHIRPDVFTDNQMS
jgi:hypothetical protein